MIAHRTTARTRRGVVAFEMAIVLPIFIILIFGILLGGQKVSRYQWVAAMARDGARYASVHGPTFSAETSGNPLVTSSYVFTNNNSKSNDSIKTRMAAVGFDTTRVTFTMSPDPITSTATTVQVTVKYQEIGMSYFPASTLSSTSIMPITY